MASDHASPGARFLEALPVRKFHGVGPAIAAKMQGLGIETGADLKTKPLAFLQPHFGKPGLWYYKIARGIDERFVEPGRPRSPSAPRILLPPIHLSSMRRCRTGTACRQGLELL
ncbi:MULTISPECIES: hypothetical protein [unclassified Mesorhizobium]|uniref:DNA polymerase thumb domain-containing protein n=1 Tax=unclassified Mesorhizobium TaxID=325217 RepID=UPI001FEE743F|nr:MULTISPECIES: hypothetical protein [unclassified Mesorhizobium]